MNKKTNMPKAPPFTSHIERINDLSRNLNTFSKHIYTQSESVRSKLVESEQEAEAAAAAAADIRARIQRCEASICSLSRKTLLGSNINNDTNNKTIDLYCVMDLMENLFAQNDQQLQQIQSRLVPSPSLSPQNHNVHNCHIHNHILLNNSHDKDETLLHEESVLVLDQSSMNNNNYIDEEARDSTDNTTLASNSPMQRHGNNDSSFDLLMKNAVGSNSSQQQATTTIITSPFEDILKSPTKPTQSHSYKILDTNRTTTSYQYTTNNVAISEKLSFDDSNNPIKPSSISTIEQHIDIISDQKSMESNTLDDSSMENDETGIDDLIGGNHELTVIHEQSETLESTPTRSPNHSLDSSKNVQIWSEEKDFGNITPVEKNLNDSYDINQPLEAESIENDVNFKTSTNKLNFDQFTSTTSNSYYQRNRGTIISPKFSRRASSRSPKVAAWLARHNLLSPGDKSVESVGEKVSARPALLKMVTEAEFEEGPQVVKVQVTLEQINTACQLLNKWFVKSLENNNPNNDQMVLQVTENSASAVLSDTFEPRKTKSILCSLCLFKRMGMEVSTSGERLFVAIKNTDK